MNKHTMSGKNLEKLTIKKLISSKGFFATFFSSSISDDAAELFHKAGNAYILETNFYDAI